MTEDTPILGIVGTAGSGKDTVAGMLRDDHGFASLAFADPLKGFVRDCWGLPNDVLWGASHLRSNPVWEDSDGKPLTTWICTNGACSWYGDNPEGFTNCRMCSYELQQTTTTARLALQTLGTNWGRGLDKNVWVRMGIRRAGMVLSNKNSLHDYHVPYREQITYPEEAVRQEGSVFGVVITDCRFVNEAQAIRAAGGRVWRVDRPDVGADIGGIAGHASEVEQLRIEPDQIVNNDGTLDDLRTAVETAVEEWRAA